MASKLKLACLVAACSVSVQAVPTHPREPCPFHQPENAQLVDNKYLVKLRPSHTLEDHFAHVGKNLSMQADFAYLDRIHFYTAVLDDETLHDRVRLDPGVELVEHDQYYDTPESHEPTDVSIETREISSTHDIQRRAFGYKGTEEVDTYWWHSQITIGKKMDPIMDKGNAYNFKGAGLGVDIYILDSGIFTDHAAFSGRAFNFRGQDNSKYTGGPATDNDGHGTHVASIAARVAPNANIINVKISCKRVGDPKNAEPSCKGGSNGGLAQAIVDITNDHVANKTRKGANFKGSVINISGGAGSSMSLGEAIRDATANGIPIAAAAGNSNNSDLPSTCANKNTICVACTDKQYRKGYISNYGSSVAVVAPGDYIMGANFTDPRNDTVKIGTSQATPQVAGAMAIFIGEEGLNKDKSDVQSVYNLIKLNSIPNIVTGFPGSTPNFLNTGIKNPKKGSFSPFQKPDGELKARNGEITLTQASVEATPTLPRPETTATSTATDAPLGPGYIQESVIASANPTEPAFYQISFTASIVEDTATPPLADASIDFPTFGVGTLTGTATATPEPAR